MRSSDQLHKSQCEWLCCYRINQTFAIFDHYIYSISKYKRDRAQIYQTITTTGVRIMSHRGDRLVFYYCSVLWGEPFTHFTLYYHTLCIMHPPPGLYKYGIVNQVGGGGEKQISTNREH